VVLEDDAAVYLDERAVLVLDDLGGGEVLDREVVVVVLVRAAHRLVIRTREGLDQRLAVLDLAADLAHRGVDQPCRVISLRRVDARYVMVLITEGFDEMPARLIVEVERPEGGGARSDRHL